MDYRTLVTVATMGTMTLMGSGTVLAEAHGDGRDPADVANFCRFIRDPNASYVRDQIVSGTPDEVGERTGVKGVRLPLWPDSSQELWYFPWSYSRGVVLQFDAGGAQALDIVAMGFDTPTC